MKFLALFLLVALAKASQDHGHSHSVAPTEFLTKQNNVYELLNHPMTYFYGAQRYPTAKEYFTTYFEKFSKPEVVKHFLQVVKGGLTPKNTIPSKFYHFKEAAALFDVFYYAKDYETFFKTATWARQAFNEMIFTYSFSLAVHHRADTQGVVVPPFYEMFPSFFTHYDVMQKCNRVKTQGYITDPKLAKFNGIEAHDEFTYTIANNFTYEHGDEDFFLSYFTNDLGLSNYYYNFHINYPFWFGGEEFGLNKERRGELFYFVYQQILARYTMARYTSGLGDIPQFSWYKPIKTGFNPQTVAYTGAPTPARPDYFHLYTEENFYELNEFQDYERRIRDAIYYKFFYGADGKKYSAYKPEDMNDFANFVQGNAELGYSNFYDYYFTSARKMLGGSEDSHNYVPSAFEHDYSATRDPMFYQFYSRLFNYFYTFKNNFPSYTKEELYFDGVTVDNVHFTPLTTYFESFEFDITNGVFQSKEEIESHKEKFTFAARQTRLNNKPFSATFDVSSTKDTEATVRVFIAPKYDEFGHATKLNENRHNFVQVDFFKYHLKSGKNTIERKSTDFAHSSADFDSTHTLYNKVYTALKDKKEFYVDEAEEYTGWPLNMLLPKGTKGGMEYYVYVVVTPFSPMASPFSPSEYPHKYDSGSDLTTGHRFYESRPLGFPFDRTLNAATFFTPNMYHTDVTIYHKDFLSTNESH